MWSTIIPNCLEEPATEYKMEEEGRICNTHGFQKNPAGEEAHVRLLLRRKEINHQPAATRCTQSECPIVPSAQQQF